MFRVADNEYDIQSASLELFSRTREDLVVWGVRIIAKHSCDGSGDVAKWNPSIIADELLQTTPGEKAFWHDIAGTTIEWEEANPDPQALFEVFETAGIYNCKCQFLAGPSGTGVQFLLEGTVDVDTDYPRLPIRVETPLSVGPMPWGKMSEQQCRSEFQRLGFKDPTEYRVINGVSSLIFLDQ